MQLVSLTRTGRILLDILPYLETGNCPMCPVCDTKDVRWLGGGVNLPAAQKNRYYGLEAKSVGTIEKSTLVQKRICGAATLENQEKIILGEKIIA